MKKPAAMLLLAALMSAPQAQATDAMLKAGVARRSNPSAPCAMPWPRESPTALGPT